MLKEIIIKVDNNHIHLNSILTVPLQCTNIPIEHCKFRSHKDIFWKVELIDYNSENKCWKMKVIDYFASDINDFDRQKSTKEVGRIAFEKFEWLQFERHLTTYQESKLLDVLQNHDTEKFYLERSKHKEIPNYSGSSFSNQFIESTLLEIKNDNHSHSKFERNPITIPYEVEFTVYFSDVLFTLGYVTFTKNIKEINAKINFKIKNDYILAEFENIKSWFARKLKTKKLKVNATIITTEGIVTEVYATSKQIAMINADLIDSIKYQRTISLTKAPRVTEIDKYLFTAEEIFGEMESEDPEGNVFKQNEKDILKFLLDNQKTRNRKQLEYLSGSKQAENNKLRFTLHPHFGYLFFIEGKENNHFVWELVNSHATYMWSIAKSEKEIELQYKRIEATINTIRNCGREQYKRAYRQNLHDRDLVFSVIEHEAVTSSLVDGFVKWKHKLNERIT